MLELGELNTLIVDRQCQLVRVGPTPRDNYDEIGGWGAQEWDALMALVARSLSPAEARQLSCQGRHVVINDKVVYRIRERFRKCLGRTVGDTIILTNRNTSNFYLNPTIKAHIVGGLIRPTSVQEPRAHDSMIDTIVRAGTEVFGAAAFDKAIGIIPDETRRRTLEEEAQGPGHWIPVPFVTHWMRAVYAGPAALAADAYEAFISRVEHHRLTPRYREYVRCRGMRLKGIQRKWAYCYDSGIFEAALSDENDRLAIRLWNHPYCEDRRSASVFAQCWRAIAEELGAEGAHVDVCNVDRSTGALGIRISGRFPRG